MRILERLGAQINHVEKRITNLNRSRERMLKENIEQIPVIEAKLDIEIACKNMLQWAVGMTKEEMV